MCLCIYVTVTLSHIYMVIKNENSVISSLLICNLNEQDKDLHILHQFLQMYFVYT